MSPHRAEISLPSDIFHHSIDTSDHLTSLFKIHETLYGGVGDSTTSTFSPSPAEVVDVVNELYELESVYENPILTYSGRPAIQDAFLLSRFVSTLALRWPTIPLMPKRIMRRAHRVIGFQQPGSHSKNREEKQRQGFQMIAVWSEVGDLAESESFDGCHLGILEHILHVSILPSLFPPPPSNLVHTSHPLYGPLHLTLRILSIVQFNESRRVVYHRDQWDLRDLIEAIIPGATLLGAIGRFLAGAWLRAIGWALGLLGKETEADLARRRREQQHQHPQPRRHTSMTPTQSNFSSLRSRGTPTPPVINSTLYSPSTSTRSPLQTFQNALAHPYDPFSAPSSSSSSSHAFPSSPSSPMLSFTTGLDTNHPTTHVLTPSSAPAYPTTLPAPAPSSAGSPAHPQPPGRIVRSRSRTNSRSWGAGSFTSLPALVGSPTGKNGLSLTPHHYPLSSVSMAKREGETGSNSLGLVHGFEPDQETRAPDVDGGPA